MLSPKPLIIPKFQEILVNQGKRDKTKQRHQYYKLISHNANSQIKLVLEDHTQITIPEI